MSALHECEHKVSVLHFVVKRTANYTDPVKGKDPIVFHCGFRRFTARPVYTAYSSSNKHRVERFFQPGGWSVATVYGFITFPPSPVLMFHPETGKMIATGRLLEVNAHRLQIKRTVLTGYPIRVRKKRAIVRYMFWNPDDVNWFKPCPLWTKHGLTGRIDEAVGTHGLMKCSFSGFVKQNDTICMSLYKRQFPPFDGERFGNVS